MSQAPQGADVMAVAVAGSRQHRSHLTLMGEDCELGWPNIVCRCLVLGHGKGKDQGYECRWEGKRSSNQDMEILFTDNLCRRHWSSLQHFQPSRLVTDTQNQMLTAATTFLMILLDVVIVAFAPCFLVEELGCFGNGVISGLQEHRDLV